MADDTVIDIKFEPDKKSADASKKSVTDMVSLIADLGIISKVAGEAMGKMWEQVGKSIDIGVQGFQSSINALVRGFSASGFNKLTEAMANIGAKGQEGAVVAQMNALLRSVLNPETGEKELEKVMETSGRFKVDKTLQDELIALLKNEDTEGSMMKLGEIINSLGTKGSEFADALKLSSLATLENDQQWADFQDIMYSTSIVYEQNNEKLNILNDSLASLNTSTVALQKRFAENLTPAVDLLARKMRDAAEFILEGRTTDKKGVIGHEGGLLNSNYEENQKARLEKTEAELSFFEKGFLSLQGLRPWGGYDEAPVELSSLDLLDGYAKAGLSLGGSSGSALSGLNTDSYADARMSEMLGTTVNVGEINLSGVAGAEEAARIIVEEIRAMQKWH